MREYTDPIRITNDNPDSDRQRVATIAERDQFVTDGRAWVGMRVWRDDLPGTEVLTSLGPANWEVVPLGAAAGPTGPTGPTGATGAAGTQIIYGTVDPTTEGNDGDTYINTTTDTIFYAKTGGVWPAGVPLIGPTGPIGPTGAQGNVGAVGPTGPQGPQGTQGATGATGPIGPTGATGAAGTNGKNPDLAARFDQDGGTGLAIQSSDGATWAVSTFGQSFVISRNGASVTADNSTLIVQNTTPSGQPESKLTSTFSGNTITFWDAAGVATLPWSFSILVYTTL